MKTVAIHAQHVRNLAGRVQELYKTKIPFKVYHGSTNSTRILSFKRSQMVDVSHLDQVIAVDRKRQIAVVEPNVPMDRLVRETLRHGLVPAVVMEFPGITVGGGIQGGAGESSSFKFGCFNQTCFSYEMVLADGSTVHASATENKDLFYGTAGSFGTLGIITAAEIQLLPAKKYVQLTYLPVHSFTDACAILRQVVTQGYDYVDGIMFGRDHGVIIVGRLSDTKKGRLRRFSRAHDEWYYLHAEKIDATGRELTETVPLFDYLFRYDRGAFWVGKYAFDLFNVPFNCMSRWFLNPLLHTRKLYQALQESGASQLHLVQDLALPQETAVEFMEYVDRELKVYPLWLCPLKPDDKSPLQSNNLDTPLVINVGVWGNTLPSREPFLQANRSLEAELTRLGGKKWFYAHSYYTEKEFWSRYDKAAYQQLRRTYHAEHLPNVYDKIKVTETYDINYKQGVLRTMYGKAKLRIED